MKNLFLFLLFIGCSQSSNALIIQQITVSALNANDINVHTKIADGYYFEYYNHNYEIMDNTITLNICYSPFLTPVGTVKQNDFILPNINLETANFTLIVNVNYRIWDGTTYTCNNQVLSDTETMSFATPLSDVVHLSSNSFENDENNLRVYPNPSHGTIEFSSDFSPQLKAIKIFDNLGRLVAHMTSFSSNSINLREFDNGIYLLEFTTDKGKISKKIVLKK